MKERGRLGKAATRVATAALACAIGVSLTSDGRAHAALLDADPFSSGDSAFSALADDPSPATVIDLSGVTVSFSDYVIPGTVTSGTSNPATLTGGQIGVTSPVTTTTDVAVDAGNVRSRIAQTHEGPGTGAVTAWRFLEDEAYKLIATQHQVSQDGAITDWGRGLMRAWMLMRLIEIIRQPASERTAEEQAAVAYLQTKVWDRQQAVIAAALDQHENWQTDPCTFDAPAPYTYGTPFGYCERNSYQSILLGTPPPPSAGDFMDYGGAIVADQGLERIVRELAGRQDLPSRTRARWSTRSSCAPPASCAPASTCSACSAAVWWTATRISAAAASRP